MGSTSRTGHPVQLTLIQIRLPHPRVPQPPNPHSHLDPRLTNPVITHNPTPNPHLTLTTSPHPLHQAMELFLGLRIHDQAGQKGYFPGLQVGVGLRAALCCC